MARLDGKPVWLEINTQRIAAAETFYTSMFGWERSAVHVDPWGTLTMFRNEERIVGSGFLAMAAFQPSRWNVFLSGSPEVVEKKVAQLGGGVVTTAEDAPGWGRTIEVFDPAGHAFTVIALEGEDPSDPCRPGDVLLVELRAPEATVLADFYATLLGYRVKQLGELTYLTSRGYPRILLRNDPHAPSWHPWIPWFRSSSIAADQIRAERYGGIVQVPELDAPGVGHAAIVADPTGAFFGLVRPTE
ncbi:MAG: hypothetical protein H6733_01835 [Alphaproteobacteria bacterium]|nr:hypothetical protein [Alphaproteobacteria bacterium]